MSTPNNAAQAAAQALHSKRLDSLLRKLDKRPGHISKPTKTG